MARWMTALGLALVFLAEVVRGGLGTAWRIVSPHRRPQPRVLRMRCPGLDDHGLVAMASLVCLTPGSTVVDIETAGRALVLHALDAADPDALVAELRARFEAPLLRLFPAGERP